MRFRTAVSVLLGGFILFFSASVAAQDQNEPNETFATATDITVGNLVSGTIHVEGDLDYFVFTVDEPGTIDLSITPVTEIELETFLYDANRVEIDNQRRSINEAMVFDFSVLSGTYYLLVKDDDNNRISVESYTLSITLDTSDAQEPNNSFFTASTVNFGEPVSGTIRSVGDLDYFQFELPQAGVIEVASTAIPGIEIETFLYDANQLEIDNQRLQEGQALSFNMLLDAGMHYLLLKDDDSRSSTTPYTLTIDLDLTDSGELNNSFQDATPLAVNSTVSATIRSDGDLDFYRVEVDAFGALFIHISSVPGIELEAYVYSAGEELIDEYKSTLGVALSFEQSVEPGVYYLVVKDDDDSRSSATPYELSTVLTAGDALEPNNTFLDASSINLDTPVNGTIMATGDWDYFEFDLPQPGVIDVHVSAVPGLELEGVLYDGNQEEILDLERQVNEPLLFSQLLPAGMHYLLVRNDVSPAVSSVEPYTLTVALDISDSNELNNTFEDATIIGPDEVIHGAIWTNGDQDYYRFETTSPGLIDVQLLNAPPIDYEVTVFDPLQQEVWTQLTRDGGAISTEVSITSAGTHYLLINGNNNSVSSSQVYDLMISGAIIEAEIDILAGDVGRNGVIDAGDASLTLRSIVGLALLNNNQRRAADVDGNNLVQAVDASLILQRIVGLIDAFPVDGAGKTTATAQQQLAWGLVQQNTTDGSYEVSFEIEGDTSNVRAAQVTLNYDPGLMDMGEVVLNTPEGWFVTQRIEKEQGTMHIAMAGAMPSSSARLGTVKVVPKGPVSNLALHGEGVLNAGQQHKMPQIDVLATPRDIDLLQNYPNPFSSDTSIRYQLNKGAEVTLVIYNMLGQEVATLVDAHQEAGAYAVRIQGLGLTSGNYLYRLTAGSVSLNRIMTVLK